MQKGISNKSIPNPKPFSPLCKKTIKKNETVIINREKEAINALAEEVQIPKSILRKTARAFHNQNVSDLVAEVSDIEALMETI